MIAAQGPALRRRLLALRPEHRARFAASLADREGLLLTSSWPVWGHDGQVAPEGDWRTWIIMAGRGFGKTRAGSEWVISQARDNGALRIALVAATLDEARRIMIEGEAGLLSVARGEIASWHASRRLLRFHSGAEATIFSGCSPEALRGPEHHLAWCDELAKWAKPEDVWAMLQLGLRRGDRPRTLITTTPRSDSILAAIRKEPGCIVTGGRSHANPHVSDAWLATIDQLYAGTRLAAQEIEGELLPRGGALWCEDLLAACRAEGDLPSRFVRIAIGVDPPSGDGTCGIVLCARDAEGTGHVIADASVTGASPERWARVVADTARSFSGRGGSPVIVAEANQGGKMVEAVLRAADPRMRIRLVHASEGKSARADPVALLFERGRVRLHGRFPELEDQLLGFAGGARYAGPGPSPDRADAMVWALTDLMLRDRPAPGVRGFDSVPRPPWWRGGG